MEILGVGPSELIFIIIIALIVLGPKDMQKAGKTVGKYLNKLVKSDGWKAFQQTSRELRNLPTNLMREANMDLAEAKKDIRKSMGQPPFAYPSRPTPAASSSSSNLNQPQEAENSIQPPSATNTAEDAPANDTDNSNEGKTSAPNQNA